MMSSQSVQGVLLLCLLSLGLASAAASTWYISPFGRNTNSGTSPSSPFLDLQTALNASSPGDTVVCASGAYTGDANVGLTISDITIVGSSTSPTTFESSSGYIFYMQGDSTLSTLTLDGGSGGVSIEGDTSSKMNLKNIDFLVGSYAIYLNQTNTLIVDGCYFNVDVNFGIYGVYNSLATTSIDTLSISNSDFQCSSTAVYISGSSTVYSAVKNLMVSDTVFRTDGRGLYLYFTKGPDNLSFTNSSFFDMHSSTTGGALSVKAKTLEVDSCLFDGNSAEDSGAAINFVSNSDGSQLTVTNSAFYESDLFSDTGMGAHIYSSTVHSVTISSSFFSGGNYADDGGAIYFSGASSVNVSYSVFYNNFSWNYGAAIRLEEVTQSAVTNSAFVDNYSYGYGGAVAVLDTAFDFSNSFVYSNSADYGGAFYSNGDLTTTFTSVDFLQNSAGIYGGAVYSLSPLMSFFSIFDSNTAVGDYYSSGGGLYLKGTTSMSVNLILNNTCEADGGGIFLYSSGTLSTRVMLVESNAGGSGGGIACSGGTMNMFLVGFTENTASYGSAYYCESSCSSTGNYIFVDTNNSVYGCSSNVEDKEMWNSTHDEVFGQIDDESEMERLNDHVTIDQELLDMMVSSKDEFYDLISSLSPAEIVPFLLSSA